MGIDHALGRFETVIGGAWPDGFRRLQPGLDDEGIERLRAVIEPYALPKQVEALYRWRNGGDPGLFGGWRMRPVDELIDWYRLTCDQLESPRTWLPVFADQIVSIVTLDVPGRRPSDPSVWYGHTHDAWLCRMFDSVEALLDVVCDAAELGGLVDRHGSLELEGDFTEPLDGRGWAAFRVNRSPSSFRWPDPPPGHLPQQVRDARVAS